MERSSTSRPYRQKKLPTTYFSSPSQAKATHLARKFDRPPAPRPPTTHRSQVCPRRRDARKRTRTNVQLRPRGRRHEGGDGRAMGEAEGAGGANDRTLSAKASLNANLPIYGSTADTDDAGLPRADAAGSDAAAITVSGKRSGVDRTGVAAISAGSRALARCANGMAGSAPVIKPSYCYVNRTLPEYLRKNENGYLPASGGGERGSRYQRSRRVAPDHGSRPTGRRGSEAAPP